MFLYALLTVYGLWLAAVTAFLIKPGHLPEKSDALAEKREKLLTEGLESLLSYSLETAMKEAGDK